jgi:hypothetical protein
VNSAIHGQIGGSRQSGDASKGLKLAVSVCIKHIRRCARAGMPVSNHREIALPGSRSDKPQDYGENHRSDRNAFALRYAIRGNHDATRRIEVENCRR